MHVTDFVESYFDAWNHADPKAIADHLTEDGIYLDVPENAQRTHDELIVDLNEFFSRQRQRYELIGDILAGRDTIAFQYRIRMLEKGGADDASTVLQGAEFMTLHGDAAVTITDYYDLPNVARPAGFADITSNRSRGRKYAKSGLSEELLLEYKTRLENVMQTEKVYLRSDLTLPRLAKAIECSVNHLSQVINSGMGMSFFDYLNRYRIEHAKTLLTANDSQGNAVLNIAFTVGFNSNSAFYAAFKKCVGQTPAQFRRENLNQAH